MHALNIHSRHMARPFKEVASLMKTLATPGDQIWPKENWPSMRFNEGLHLGAKGGHGPIQYSIEDEAMPNSIQFRFIKPRGFDGIHRLELLERGPEQTEIKHTIDMRTRGLSTLTWLFLIRPLHNALIEDAFDKVENHFSGGAKRTKWHWWVRLLRWLFS